MIVSLIRIRILSVHMGFEVVRFQHLTIYMTYL